ncbi:hypothetical protein [Pararhodobacter sp.]|uniref:hypothetical protein n=1 Tax=Pararhodobacter sp. TaxID=2127056 RepID=UPI002AFE533D|nr:hypothetical protein [Pararhodobacter sp.]
MKIYILAALPLALAACAAPAALPDGAALTTAADPTTSRSAATLPALLTSFTPRPVVRPADWQRLNDLQAPGGAQIR